MIDFASLLFKIDIPQECDPQVGSLLVAEPFLKESYFNHAVICLVDHSEGQSSMGVVLNRISGHELQDLIDGISCADPVTVYCGGPVACDRLYFLHTLGPDIIPDTREVSHGLWIGGDFEAVKDYISAGYPVDGHIRFFIGYSGWDAGQLDDELRQSVWAITQPGSADTLLTGAEDSMWHRYVRSMGTPYSCWRYHPQNPRAN